MNEPVTIPNIENEADTLYQQLRSKGISYLEELAGGVWTDFNEHDPGVTILEALCYALTDLINRADFPIENLLASSNGTLPASENALFSAATILHTNPLTINDYRKLIIDRNDAINNAWLEVYGPPAGINGLYRVTVDLKDGSADGEAVKQTVTELMNTYRNLGEGLGAIEILAQQQLSVGAVLYLDDNAVAEEVVALMLVDLDRYFNPQVKFRSLQEMQEDGNTNDAIFEGPSLLHGFIRDEDLSPRKTRFFVAELLRMMIGIDGINSVSGLYVTDDSGKKTEDVYSLGSGKSARLDASGSIAILSVFQKSVKRSLNQNLVLSYYNNLRSVTQPGKFRLSQSQLDLPIPNGTYSSSDTYYSIQHEFPGIYGIGSTRISDEASATRKAQALQLKAYLLFFEQLMADYFSQLANISNLFSTHTQHRTYFDQPLYMVPDVAAVLNGYSGDPAHIYDNDHGQDYLRSSLGYINDDNPYEEGLEALTRRGDYFKRRRTDFLNHLLSRFNYTPYLFQDVSKTENNELQPKDILVKERLLRYMPSITAERAYAGDTRIMPGRVKPLPSGLENVLSLLSGMRNGLENEKIAELFQFLVINKQGTGTNLFSHEKGERVLLQEAHPLFFAALSSIHSKDDLKAERIHNSLVRLKALIQTATGTEEIVLIDYEEKEEGRLVENFIDLLTAEFRQAYQFYERFFLIDHLLLKPDNNEMAFAASQNPDNSWLSYDAVLQANPQSVFVKVGDTIADAGFYSLRLSLVLPEEAINRRTESFRNYMTYTATANCPAHLQLEVLWLNAAEFFAFTRIYQAWLNDPVANREALTGFLLKQTNGQSLI